jgi:hypothetical protein
VIQIEVGFSLFDWIVNALPSWLRSYIPQFVLDRLRPEAETWQKRGEELLSQKLDPIITPLRPVFLLLTNFKEATFGLFGKASKLATDIRQEYDAIKNFKEDLHWKGRAINVPNTVRRIKRLAEIPSEVATRLRDLWQALEQQVGVNPAKAAEEAVNALEGIEDFRGFITRFAPKLAKGLEKLLGVLAIAVDCVVAWNRAIDDLQVIVTDIREVRLDIEKLELAFLSQEHKRRYVRLEDGRTVRWRIGGRMHPQ